MTSHVVFGAGLIGCYLGGVFAAKTLAVRLVCRQHVQQKLQQGLRLTDYQDHQLDVPKLSFIDPQMLSQEEPASSPCDVLWLTVKCTAVAQAAEDIAPLVGEQTLILCCQNGLGSEKIIKERYPGNRVLRVMVPFNVSEPSAGHLHRGSEGALAIESPADGSSLTRKLVEAVAHPLLPVVNSEDMQALLWAKLQLNLGNSVNALADVPVKTMLQQRGYRLVIAALMKELLAVVDQAGIQLPKVTALPAHMIPKVLALPTFVFKLVANKMLAIDPEVRTSMWWDLSQSKQTEIEHLNGAIVREGKKYGLQSPVNDIIIGLIHQIEQDNQQGAPRVAITAEALLAKIRS